MISYYMNLIEIFFFSHLILFAVIGLIAFLFLAKTSYILIRISGILLFFVSIMYYFKMI